MDHIVYDVEIAKEVNSVPGKWDNPEGMGFGSAVAYSYDKDQYFFFLHEQGRAGLIELLDRNKAIGFNSIKFDSRVVLGNERKSDGLGETWRMATEDESYVTWKNTDLLLEYIKARFDYGTVGEAENRLGDRAIHDGSFSLDGIAEGTFGLKKIGHGAHAPLLYQQEKYAELLEYNLHDVRLTKLLWEFSLKHKFVVDRKGRVVRFFAI